MPSTNVPGLWLADQNTKIPSISHLLSYKVQLAAANTSTASPIIIPTAYNNPAQQIFPGPVPSGEPPQGKRFFTTVLAVRDPNGPLGGTAGGSIALVDTTTNVTIGSVPLSTTAGFVGTLYNMLTSLPANGAVNANDVLGVSYVAPTTASGTTGTIFTLDVFGFWQQNV